MKTRKIFISITAIMLLLSVILLVGCNSDKNSGSSTGAQEIIVPDSSTMFTDKDKDADYSDSDITANITVSGSKISSDSTAVSVSNGKATISKTGYYVIGGSGKNVSIIVDCTLELQKIHLVLKDLTITNSSFAPIYVKNAEKTFVMLEGNNTLGVTGDFEQIDENNVDGVIFAKDNVTIQGDGSLTINSSKHGIVNKDDLKITGGTINVTASSDGLQANDSVRIADATVTVNAQKDGVHIENTVDTAKGYFYLESGTLNITSAHDGIDVSSTVQITGGTLTVKAGGGNDGYFAKELSTKGIKAVSDILIKGGTITVDSSDDAVHSNDSIEIDGGNLDLTSGDDGIHADKYLLIKGGTIKINESYEGLEAQNIEIEGGNISIRATDDGINSAGGDGSSINGRPGQNNFNSSVNSSITIKGGNIYVNAYGDGVDSNGNITITGGVTVVEGPVSNGDGALDYDGKATISGGTFVAIGSNGMAMNFSTAEQGSILVSCNSQSIGADITLKDSNGNEIFSMTSTKKFSSVLISVPELEKGKTYSLSAGTYSKDVTLTDFIYGAGSSMPGGGGGRPGGGGFRP